MYWEPDRECMDREELEQLQFERLQSTLNRIYSHVPFYRKRFDALGILPEDIGSLADFSRLPFTAKEDLRESYPYGLFAVPLREVVRIHASSGTTGASTVVGYTRNDIRIWSNLTARVLTMGGVTKDDVVQIAFGYGLFTGGFGLHYGAERIGASVIPASSGHTLRQIKIMMDFKTKALGFSPPPPPPPPPRGGGGGRHGGALEPPRPPPPQKPLFVGGEGGGDPQGRGLE